MVAVVWCAERYPKQVLFLVDVECVLPHICEQQRQRQHHFLSLVARVVEFICLRVHMCVGSPEKKNDIASRQTGSQAGSRSVY